MYQRRRGETKWATKGTELNEVEQVVEMREGVKECQCPQPTH